MNRTTKSIAMMVEVMLSLLVASTNISAQATVDFENKFPNVGALMVWLVDESGNPTRLLGFASGTLISDRVMVTAGHFTAPAKALGKMPPNIRVFASFSPTNARDPKTWIPVVRQATHPSCPCVHRRLNVIQQTRFWSYRFSRGLQTRWLGCPGTRTARH